MVRLRTLGTLDLSSDGDDACGDLLGQPKRIALLAFLALRSANGPVSRDRLLGLFWPDLSQTRGRRALSQSLYVLRKSLGEGLIETVGQEAIRLNADFIWCDALEFEDALSRGDPEHALSLYGGDLLDGFFLTNTAEFEKWLDLERGRLRQLGTECAKSLTARDEAAGDLLAASRWARRAVRLTPWDEGSLIQLIELLGAAGDQSGAQLEYDAYREALRSELGAEPSVNVEAALVILREAVAQRSWDSRDALPEPNAIPEESPVLVSSVPASHQRRWRTPAILTAAVFLSILVFSQSSRQAFRDGGATPRVLVAPFANQTGNSDLDPLARLAADWLATEIARTGRIRVVPPVSALRLVAQTEVEGDTTMFGRAVAAGARAQVNLVIGGYVSGTRDSTVFEVYGLDPASGELLFALQPLGPSEGTELTTLERLRRAAIGALASHLDDRMRRWSGPAGQPPSYESYQEYSEALDTFFDEGDRATQERAAEMFLALWRSDTTFIAPLSWSVFALANAGQPDRADSVAHALESRVASLPEWDRAMLRYNLAYLHGDLPTQYRTASEIVNLAPDSEWRFKLAGAARRIGCRDEALLVLRDLNPHSGWMTPAYWTMRMELRHLAGDPPGESRDAASAMKLLPDELYPGETYSALAAQIRAAAIGESAAELESYLGEVRSLGRRAHILYLKLFDWGPFDLSSNRVEYQVILDSARAWYADRPAADRPAVWYLFAQWVLAYRGARWAEAEEYLDRLVEAGWPPYPEYLWGPRAVLAARRGESARASAILDSMPPAGHMASYSDFDQDFFKARVAAILGEPAKAVNYLRSSNRKGIPYEDIHGMARIDFETMWDYRPLQRLLGGHSCE